MLYLELVVKFCWVVDQVQEVVQAGDDGELVVVVAEEQDPT